MHCASAVVHRLACHGSICWSVVNYASIGRLYEQSFGRAFIIAAYHEELPGIDAAVDGVLLWGTGGELRCRLLYRHFTVLAGYSTGWLQYWQVFCKLHKTKNGGEFYKVFMNIPAPQAWCQIGFLQAKMLANRLCWATSCNFYPILKALIKKN